MSKSARRATSMPSMKGWSYNEQRTGQLGVTRLTEAEHTLRVPNRCIMAVSPAKREKSGSLKGLGSISEAFHTFG